MRRPRWRKPITKQWLAWTGVLLGWTLDAFDFTTFLLGRQTPLLISIAWFSVAVVACTSNTQTNRLAVSTARLTSPLLTETEISSVDPATALDAIRQLRPHYLWTTIVSGEAHDPVVYVDGVRLAGGVEALRAIAATTIHEIRRLDALDATARFGTGHQGGAIVIATKGGH